MTGTNESAGRLDRLQAQMAEAGVDLVAIAPTPNMRYLLGFAPLADERLCLLLVTPQSTRLVAPELTADQIETRTGMETIRWTDDSGPQQALTEAKEYLDKLLDAADWDELTREAGLTTETTDFFTRRDSIPQIGYDPAIMEVVFALSAERRYPDKVIEGRDGVFVVRWEGEEGIDEEGFEGEKERYRSMISRMKYESWYGAWLTALKDAAEIEIVTPVDTL